MNILRPDEIERIERDFSVGISARAIVDIFRPHGVRLSEATFRKYVQAGLLPRSRRVGRKGKHRGSQGLYPVESVRRINVIKKMMAEGQTLDDIKNSFVFFKNHIDSIERELGQVLDGFEARLATKQLGDRNKRELSTQLNVLRSRSTDLVRDVSRLGSAVMAKGSQAEQVGAAFW